MKRYFTQKHLVQLREKLQTIGPKTAALVAAILLRMIGPAGAGIIASVIVATIGAMILLFTLRRFMVTAPVATPRPKRRY